MAYEIMTNTCPNCGAKIDNTKRKCDFCGNPITIIWNDENGKSIDSDYLIKTEHFISLGMYQEGIEYLEKISGIICNDADVYFLLSILYLNGKKPFLCKREQIDKAVNYIERAIALEQKGIYYLLYAYILFDYFERKCLKIKQNYQMVFKNTDIYKYEGYEKNNLEKMLKVEGQIREEMFLWK